MKKNYAILAVAAVFVCTAFAVSSYSSRDPFFEANVEALSRSEIIGSTYCGKRMNYSSSRRNFKCDPCELTNGEILEAAYCDPK